MGSLCW